MKVIFHIGAPKTGTSALQWFLHENRLALQDLGFYYPEHGFDGNQISGGHAFLGEMLRDEDFHRANDIFFSWVECARVASCDLILSAESLYSLAGEVANLVSGLDLDIEVLGYFRDPLSVIKSNYNQLVKRHLETATFDEYVAMHLSRIPDEINGNMFIDWIDKFGSKLVTVAPYVKSSFPEGKIELSFLKHIGVNEEFWHKFSFLERRVNTSYTNEALELKRLINILLPAESNMHNELDQCLQRYSDRMHNSGDIVGDACSYRDISVLHELCNSLSVSNKVLTSQVLSDSPKGFLDYEDVLSFHESEHISQFYEIQNVWNFVDESMPGFSSTMKKIVDEKADAGVSPDAAEFLSKIIRNS